MRDSVTAIDWRGPSEPIAAGGALGAHHAIYSSKSDMVTAALRELLITGALNPGMQLRQRDLAEQFGVSTTPVREALRRLEAQGLVSDARGGTFVVEGEFGTIEENYRIRAELEALAVRFAAERMTEDEFAEIERAHVELAACSSHDPRRTALNREFHFLIYKTVRSPLLAALLRLLWQAFPNGPQAVRPARESAAQHAEIVDALRVRDGGRASHITRGHILGALDYLPDRSLPDRSRGRRKP